MFDGAKQILVLRSSSITVSSWRPCSVNRACLDECPFALKTRGSACALRILMARIFCGNAIFFRIIEIYSIGDFTDGEGGFFRKL